MGGTGDGDRGGGGDGKVFVHATPGVQCIIWWFLRWELVVILFAIAEGEENTHTGVVRTSSSPLPGNKCFNMLCRATQPHFCLCGNFQFDCKIRSMHPAMRNVLIHLALLLFFTKEQCGKDGSRDKPLLSTFRKPKSRISIRRGAVSH